MKPIEPQLERLRERVNMIDTAPSHQKIETQLRSAWKETRSTQTMSNQTKTHAWNLSRWTLILSGSGIGALALVTAIVTPAPVAQPSGSTTQYTERAATTAKETAQFDSVSSNLALGSSNSRVNVSDLSFESEAPMIIDDGYGGDTDKDYTYIDNEEAKQLFAESVVLSIDVKQDILDVLNSVRTRINEQEGVLISVNYYRTSGTVEIKLPADQLGSFEEELKKLDVNHKITVSSYNVVNVSDVIVKIDSEVANARKRIENMQKEIDSGTLSEDEKQDLRDIITAENTSIEKANTERTEAIAKYEMVSVRLVINQYQSFWSGNYYQYDTSTFSGLIKYQFGKALYSLIHGSSKVLGFIIWLAVYSVIYIPVFLILRKIIRSIRRKIQSRKNTAH